MTAQTQTVLVKETDEEFFAYAELTGSAIAARERDGLMRFDVPPEDGNDGLSGDPFTALVSKCNEVMREKGVKDPEANHVFEAEVLVGDKKCRLTSIKTRSERYGEMREISVSSDEDKHHIVASCSQADEPNVLMITSADTMEDLNADIVAIRLS